MLSHEIEMAASRGDGKTQAFRSNVGDLYKSPPRKVGINYRMPRQMAAAGSWHAGCKVGNVTERCCVHAGWIDRFLPVSRRSTLPGATSRYIRIALVILTRARIQDDEGQLFVALSS
jgi:hypothetical protein